MHWTEKYQLALFDFDGLLVNTEELHFLAYRQMCEHYGFNLDWSFDRYCQSAHYDALALRDALYLHFPDLYAKEPSWDVLYAEKKKRIIALLKQGAVELMPGVVELLQEMERTGIKRCVVTHSSNELVDVVREQYPILNTIPTWFTRTSYTHPKPHPECYLHAIDQLAEPTDKVIGFEDTPRGIRALMGTRAQPVIVCTTEYPEIPHFLEQGVLRYHTLQQFIL